MLYFFINKTKKRIYLFFLQQTTFLFGIIFFKSEKMNNDTLLMNLKMLCFNLFEKLIEDPNLKINQLKELSFFMAEMLENENNYESPGIDLKFLDEDFEAEKKINQIWKFNGGDFTQEKQQRGAWNHLPRPDTEKILNKKEKNQIKKQEIYIIRNHVEELQKSIEKSIHVIKKSVFFKIFEFCESFQSFGEFPSKNIIERYSVIPEIEVKKDKDLNDKKTLFRCRVKVNGIQISFTFEAESYFDQNNRKMLRNCIALNGLTNKFFKQYEVPLESFNKVSECIVFYFEKLARAEGVKVKTNMAIPRSIWFMNGKQKRDAYLEICEFIKSNMISPDDYNKLFSSEEFKRTFFDYTMNVFSIRTFNFYYYSIRFAVNNLFSEFSSIQKNDYLKSLRSGFKKDPLSNPCYLDQKYRAENNETKISELTFVKFV